MRFARTARWLLLAFLVSLVPATSHAGVFISVGFAPPPLVEYVQPPCPEPGWMWEPGYWAYGDDGYYWVPGTWVPAPYVGAYWTPGYWGWNAGMYLWHPGYWGPHVGYYGGVNYGFGYMGVGFVGGMWRGNVFAYNTAVMHVNRSVIHNVYEDRNIVRQNTIADSRHVAYSGGPGGINHPPTAQERAYMRQPHPGATAYQTQHAQAAMQNRNAYYNNNHGHPATAAQARPTGAPGGRNGYINNQGARNQMTRPQQQARPMEQQRPQQQQRPMQQARPESRPQPQARPEQRPQQRPQARPQGHEQPHNDSHDHPR